MTNATTKKRLLTLVITGMMLCMTVMSAWAAQEISTITIKVKTTGDLSLPEITTDSSKYKVEGEPEWSQTEDLKAGQKLTAKVTIAPEEGYEILIAKKDYSKKIKVTGGAAEFSKAERKDRNYIVTIKYVVRGDLEEPNPYWDEDKPWVARCDSVENATRYEFVLYRENWKGKRTTVAKVETKERNCNFAKDLAKYYYKHDDEPDDYEFYFRVRAISNKSFVSESDFQECEDVFDDWYDLWYYCVDRGISLGEKESSSKPDTSYYPDYCRPGSSPSSKKTGWSQENGRWYFYNNDGRKLTGWISNGGNWYHLDNNGAMQTGWLQDRDGLWYYLNANGTMRKGWFQDWDGKYYYFSTDGTGTKEGAMVKGGWHIGGASYYFYPNGGYINGQYIKEGEMAVNTMVEGGWYGSDGRWSR